MEEQKRIVEILQGKLRSVYCDTCVEKMETDACDYCVRKSMGWGISKEFAENIANTILDEETK